MYAVLPFVSDVENTTNSDVKQYFGHLTIVADGYASKFRKEYIKHQPISRSKFWGLELIDADLPHPHHGHVILSDSAPILLYQIGTHETRALIDIPENLPSASIKNGGVKSHLKNVVLPSLPKSVQPSFDEALANGGLRSMPNSFLPPTTNKTPGMIILGDAMNMRHPLTGGGMTVAFNDVVLLTSLLSPDVVPRLEDTKLVIRQMSTFHWRRKSLTSVINILAQALYSLFAANGTSLPFLSHRTPSDQISRPATQDPPERLLPVLPARRILRRRARRPPRRHHPPAPHALLPLLRRRPALDLDHAARRHGIIASIVEAPHGGVLERRRLLQGVSRPVPVHLLRVAGLDTSLASLWVIGYSSAALLHEDLYIFLS